MIRIPAFCIILSILILGAPEAHLIAQGSSGSDVVIVVPNRNTTVELKVRGRLQGQFTHSTGSDDAGDYNSFEMRRARLGVQGKIRGDWSFLLEVNALSTVDIDAATVTYTAVPEANITFGKGKPIFGHEENTSSASILTMERTRATGLFNGGKPLGLRLHGNIDIFSYYLGVYNGQNVSTGRMGSDQDSYLINASAGLRLDKMIGDGVTARIRADFLNSSEETGYYGFENAFAVSGHFATGGFDLRAEYMNGSRHDDNSVHAFYVMPSFFLVPKTFQAILRYEMIDADDGVAIGHNRYADRVPGLFGAGNEYNAIYAGINYYIHGDNMKLMLGFEQAENKHSIGGQKGSVASIVGGIRLQF